MASRRKNRQGKKLMTMEERLQKVVAAMKKLRMDIACFFESAARELSLSKARLAREAEKFKKVMADGLERHRGYKVPHWALNHAQQLLGLADDSAAAHKTHGTPKTVMRPAPAYA
jgi:hypothetical protein